MTANVDVILVLGHTGLVGRAICRLLDSYGVPYVTASVDLRDESQCEHLFQEVQPSYVFHCAARVGGIQANNTKRVDFLADNLRIGLNVLKYAHESGVKKLLNLGSSCIYPKHASQPMAEDALLSGPLEPTNSAYALAKISIVELCKAYRTQYGCNFISAMPCNLYGPFDNFTVGESHVMPSLIRKFIAAKDEKHDAVTLWGDGSPRREFLHVDDLASACWFLMIKYDDADHINVGANDDCTIAELAARVSSAVGYDGNIVYDTSMPNGTARKLLDTSKLMGLGWRPQISLEEGLQKTIEWVQGRLREQLPIRGWTQ